MVLGRRAQHGRTANVDILDAFLERRAFGDGPLERVEIDEEQVDLGNRMGCHGFAVFGIVAPAKQSTVNPRVQRLQPAVHHLGKLGHIRNVEGVDTCGLEGFQRAAGGQDFHAAVLQAARAVFKAVLVGQGDQGAPDRNEIGLGHGGSWHHRGTGKG